MPVRVSPSMRSSTTRRSECYVDTSALIAFLDRSDSYHPIFKRLFSEPPPLVASGLVIAEGHGWFLRRYDQRRAVQFLRFIEELPALSILAFGSDEAIRAGRVAKKFSDQALTLADAHGLVVMGRAPNRDLLVDGPPSGVNRCGTGDLIYYAPTTASGPFPAAETSGIRLTADKQKTIAKKKYCNPPSSGLL